MCMWVRQARSLRLWFGVPAVLVGAVIGLLTNIVTTKPTWPFITGLVAAVAVLVGLTVWQPSRNERDRLTTPREARAKVLKPLRPDLQGAHTISTLPAAEHAPAPFRAPPTAVQTFTHWCL